MVVKCKDGLAPHAQHVMVSLGNVRHRSNLRAQYVTYNYILITIKHAQLKMAEITADYD
jgi:hypothetical protein